MDYKDALEFCIEATERRIGELGAMADELRDEIASSEDSEQWAALKSAQGGMRESLDLMQQALTMAKSFDTDPAGIGKRN